MLLLQLCIVVANSDPANNGEDGANEKGSSGNVPERPVCSSKGHQCTRALFSTLEPHINDYEQCDMNIQAGLAKMAELRKVIETAEIDAKKPAASVKGQVRNMIAQNTKLVSELAKYQGFSTDNEKMQRTIRKTSTELDLLKTQVEVLQRKLKDVKKTTVDVERESRHDIDRCEEEVGLLKDVYWSNSLKVPDAAHPSRRN